MAKQTPAMIPMMGKEAVVTKFTFLYMKLCHKLYYPKKQLSVGKSFALLKCQLHFKQYIKTKRVCFEIKLYKLTSSNGTTLIFSVNSRKRMFHNGGENRDVTSRRNPFSPTISFLLLITPDIPRVLGSNYAIKRLSSVRYFFKRKLQEGASLCPHEKVPIKHFLLQQGSKQTRFSLRNHVYLSLFPK